MVVDGHTEGRESLWEPWRVVHFGRVVACCLGFLQKLVKPPEVHVDELLCSRALTLQGL